MAGEHFLQSAITTVGTIGTGVWQGTAIDKAYLDDEVLNTSLNSYTSSNDTAATVQNNRLTNKNNKISWKFYWYGKFKIIEYIKDSNINYDYCINFRFDLIE